MWELLFAGEMDVGRFRTFKKGLPSEQNVKAGLQRGRSPVGKTLLLRGQGFGCLTERGPAILHPQAHAGGRWGTSLFVLLFSNALLSMSFHFLSLILKNVPFICFLAALNIKNDPHQRHKQTNHLDYILSEITIKNQSVNIH